LPLKVEATGGEILNYKGIDIIYDADTPGTKVPIADNGYDSNHILDPVVHCGRITVIPLRPNEKILTQLMAISMLFAIRSNYISIDSSAHEDWQQDTVILPQAISISFISYQHDYGSGVCQHDPGTLGALGRVD